MDNRFDEFKWKLFEYGIDTICEFCCCEWEPLDTGDWIDRIEAAFYEYSDEEMEEWYERLDIELNEEYDEEDE